jgi:hypothetical protein
LKNGESTVKTGTISVKTWLAVAQFVFVLNLANDYEEWLVKVSYADKNFIFYICQPEDFCKGPY